MYTFGQYHVPEHLEAGLRCYILEGCPVGDFLSAVIDNDLQEAIGRADEESAANLKAIVGYLYNEALGKCWGSREKRLAWIESFKQKQNRVRLTRPTSDGLPREDELTFGRAH